MKGEKTKRSKSERIPAGPALRVARSNTAEIAKRTLQIRSPPRTRGNRSNSPAGLHGRQTPAEPPPLPVRTHE